MARIAIKHPMAICKQCISGTIATALFAVVLTSGCTTVPGQAQLLHNGSAVANCSLPVAGTPPSEGLDAEGFSLTTWNIHKGKQQGWEQDLQVLSEHSDLLLLQEAYLAPELRQWLDRESLDWVMAHAFSLRGYWSGVLTGSRASQLNPCMQRINEPYLRLPKTALISYFPIQGSGQPLLVVNVHGVNFTLGSADLDAQFQAIQTVMDSHQGPIIMAGDFNTWNRARMAVIRHLADRNRLSTVTFAGRPVVHFGHRLDYIYYRGLIPLQSKVTEVKSSDHHPLTTTFRLDSNT